MSTLRINNIEAQSIPASPTIDEKVKVTNSSGDILVNIDGKTSGITTIGINTTDGNIKFDANSNVLITGILTATTLAGNFTPDSLEIGSNIKLGNAGVITATSFVGNIGGNPTFSGNLTIPDSIIHSGDTDTKIRFPTTDNISFETGGTERFRIKADGISQFTGKITNSSSFTSHNTNFYGGNVNTGGVRIEVAHTTATVSGNTASASFPHHLLLSNYSGNGSADNRMCSIGFDIPTTSTHANAVIAYQATAAGTGDLQFHLESGNSISEKLRITSAGKIGIGHHIATQITKELTIRPVNDGGILIGRPGDTVAPINSALTITTTTTGSEAYHTKYHTYNCNSIFATYEGGGTGGNLIFKTGVGNGNESERLRITSTGIIDAPTQAGFYARMQNDKNNVMGGSAAYYTVLFDSDSGSICYNQDNAYATGTGLYTVPAGGDGHYMFSTAVCLSTQCYGRGGEAWFLVGSNRYFFDRKYFTSTSGTITGYYGTSIIKLTAGQTVGVQAFISGGSTDVDVLGATAANHITWFTGRKIP